MTEELDWREGLPNPWEPKAGDAAMDMKSGQMVKFVPCTCCGVPMPVPWNGRKDDPRKATCLPCLREMRKGQR